MTTGSVMMVEAAMTTWGRGLGSLEHGLIVVQCAAAGLVYPTNLVSIQAQPEGLIWLGFEIGVGIHLDAFRPQLHGYQVVGAQGFDDEQRGL